MHGFERLSGKARERRRHAVQRAAIARQIAEVGALGRGHCIVELGAGNGAGTLARSSAHVSSCRSSHSWAEAHEHRAKGSPEPGRAT